MTDKPVFRVLVVDDDTMSRTKLAIAITKLGHTVEKASSGADALETLKTSSVDVILLDLLMPDMDGFEVLDAIEHDNDIAKTPTIIVSSIDDEESITRAMSLGAKSVLAKNYTAEQLQIALIESVN